MIKNWTVSSDGPNATVVLEFHEKPFVTIQSTAWDNFDGSRNMEAADNLTELYEHMEAVAANLNTIKAGANVQLVRVALLRAMMYCDVSWIQPQQRKVIIKEVEADKEVVKQ